MKKIAVTAMAALVLSAPAVSFAQSTDGGVSRAQVRSELVTLEQAGYRPNSDYNSYPAQLQAAEKKIGIDSSYGSSTAGNSSAGYGPRALGGVSTGVSTPSQSVFFGQ